MIEPTMVRCTRCSALVALQDATRCGHHETDPLCTFCWKDHLIRAEPSLLCWGEVGVLDWR